MGIKLFEYLGLGLSIEYILKTQTQYTKNTHCICLIETESFFLNSKKGFICLQNHFIADKSKCIENFIENKG